MKAVLICVLLVVAGVAIYYAVNQASKEPEAPTIEVAQGNGVGEQAFIDPDLTKKGVPAPGDPDFNVDVELEQIKGRFVFHFTVTEAHGWAANGVYVELRNHGLPLRTGKGMLPDRSTYILCRNAPLRFDQPLKFSVTVDVPREFPELIEFGASENWSATVSNYSDLTAKADSPA